MASDVPNTNNELRFAMLFPSALVDDVWLTLPVGSAYGRTAAAAGVLLAVASHGNARAAVVVPGRPAVRGRRRLVRRRRRNSLRPPRRVGVRPDGLERQPEGYAGRVGAAAGRGIGGRPPKPQLLATRNAK